MTNLTENELNVLVGIIKSDYISNSAKDPVWSWSIAHPWAGTKKISGVCSSLAQKGLVSAYQAGKESTIELTDAGVQELNERGLLPDWMKD